jgi:hypothetical protein
MGIRLQAALLSLALGFAGAAAAATPSRSPVTSRRTSR